MARNRGEFMNHADYHADPAISSSHLNEMAKSPAHYYARYLDSNRPFIAPTAAMKFGSLAHCAVLEPEELSKRYRVCPSRSTREGKAVAKQMEADGIEAVTQTDWDTAAAMKTAVYAHPIAKKLLSDGIAEQPFWWNDAGTSQKCKCRPDWLTPQGTVVELKTTQDASPNGFAKSVAAFRYHVQAAHYLTGLARHGYARLITIAVEKAYPFAVAVYELDSDALEEGERLAERDIRRISYCREHDDWPCYTKDIEPLRLPKWAYDNTNTTIVF